MTDILILIPARYHSSRFPGKPLAKISGKSLIERVYQNCKATGFDLAVVTDSDKIEDHVKNFNGNVVRIDDDVSSGTERINLAYQRNFEDKNYKLIINVQGDEPLIKCEELLKLGKFHLDNPNFDITTLVKKHSKANSDFENPNIVKVIHNNSDNRCHYFSRAPIPYDRDQNGDDFYWLQHIGIYCYKYSSLAKFSIAPPTYNEGIEKLEQLRALEYGMLIGAIETKLNLIGVDTPEDIFKVEGVLNEQES
jgi:3-deoxy-manno-octulosonate cytidylyltransferase (CMP-KDO synthetase)